MPTVVIYVYTHACVNDKGNVISFFGLSGIGKTTLSASKGLTLLEMMNMFGQMMEFSILKEVVMPNVLIKKRNEPEIYNAIKR